VNAGIGGLGSVIARQLAAGGEILRLSSADHETDLSAKHSQHMLRRVMWVGIPASP
jgi:hypothetical protein